MAVRDALNTDLLSKSRHKIGGMSGLEPGTLSSESRTLPLRHTTPQLKMNCQSAHHAVSREQRPHRRCGGSHKDSPVSVLNTRAHLTTFFRYLRQVCALNSPTSKYPSRPLKGAGASLKGPLKSLSSPEKSLS
ncbi:hypothetical protein Bbelb_152550 [Branchiostoma belcheri]|nr:hypothetical protein Bbelb_152550 [Branchiostoma belcheri]